MIPGNFKQWVEPLYLEAATLGVPASGRLLEVGLSLEVVHRKLHVNLSTTDTLGPEESGR